MISKTYNIDLEPACIYLRKSREDREAEARGEGETLAKHKKALFRLAKELQINVTKVYEEIVSGESLIHRPEMLELLKDVEEGKWKSVLCMDMDRLGRGNMQEQGLILETFKKANTKIITPRKIYDLQNEFDEEYSEFEAFMARKELKIITRRLQGGRVRSVQEGNYIGTRPPYGYLIEEKDKNRYLVPHPEQAPVVKMIFDWYTHEDPSLRMGANKIANELNRLGYRSYTGIEWKSFSVLSILKNPVYIGIITWKKKEYKKSVVSGKRKDVRTRPKEEWIYSKGKHQPLVREEQFTKAQEILKNKYHVPYQLQNGIVNPLAGLIKCDICGSAMVLRVYTNQRPHFICYNTRCPNKSSRFEFVENRVIEGLRNWLREYQAKWNLSKPQLKTDNVIDIRRKALQNLEKELSELEKQKGRLHDLLERGIYDEETFLERSRTITERIDTTKTAIVNAEKALNDEMQRVKAQVEIIPMVQNALDIYSELKSPAEKNNLLKSILEYGTYRKEKHQKGDEFTLILFPKLPKSL
jgi:DNA invertase Pin-like site-specific DNA recombinase